MRKTLILTATLVLGGSLLLAVQGFGGGDLKFPHSTHLENGLDCSDCHQVDKSQNLETSLLPTLDVCTQCHDQSDLANWGFTKIPEFKSGFRTFSHQAHLEGGLECKNCHPGILAAAGTVEPLVAGHSTCFECHNGIELDNACEFCHSDLRDGRLSDMQPDPTLMMPMDHHPGFLGSHEFQVRLQGTECRECHRQEDFCSTCHLGDNVVELVHGRNWLYVHPLEARKNLRDCEACHDPADFCSDCHASSGVQPVSHLAPGWTGGANLHAETARRDISYCASCHEDDGDMVCSRCHKDDGIRGNQPRLNIHPAGFRDDVAHGWWHDDEAASCFACHQSTHTPGVGFCGYCHGPKN